jgi:hypothetical protein
MLFLSKTYLSLFQDYVLILKGYFTQYTIISKHNYNEINDNLKHMPFDNAYRNNHVPNHIHVLYIACIIYLYIV